MILHFVELHLHHPVHQPMQRKNLKKEEQVHQGKEMHLRLQDVQEPNNNQFLNVLAHKRIKRNKMHYIVLVFFGASNVSHVLYKFVSSFCLSHSSKMEHRRGAPPRRNFQCRVCQQVFNTFILARDHFLADHLYQTLAQARQNLRCGICAEHYVRISHHLSSRHIKLNIPCNRCNNVILHSDKVYDNHIKDIHPAPEGSIFNVIETAYSGRVQTFLATFLENRHLNLESSFIALANPLIALVK